MIFHTPSENILPKITNFTTTIQGMLKNTSQSTINETQTQYYIQALLWNSLDKTLIDRNNINTFTFSYKSTLLSNYKSE